MWASPRQHGAPSGNGKKTEVNTATYNTSNRGIYSRHFQDPLCVQQTNLPAAQCKFPRKSRTSAHTTGPVHPHTYLPIYRILIVPHPFVASYTVLISPVPAAYPLPPLARNNAVISIVISGVAASRSSIHGNSDLLCVIGGTDVNRNITMDR